MEKEFAVWYQKKGWTKSRKPYNAKQSKSQQAAAAGKGLLKVDCKQE
jgi:hypothetical protein